SSPNSTPISKSWERCWASTSRATRFHELPRGPHPPFAKAEEPNRPALRGRRPEGASRPKAGRRLRAARPRGFVVRSNATHPLPEVAATSNPLGQRCAAEGRKEIGCSAPPPTQVRTFSSGSASKNER